MLAAPERKLSTGDIYVRKTRVPVFSCSKGPELEKC